MLVISIYILEFNLDNKYYYIKSWQKLVDIFNLKKLIKILILNN